jgi:hypothetical protein
VAGLLRYGERITDVNLDQVQALIRTLLAAGGPIAALAIMYGIPGDKVAAWTSLALAVLPPIAAGVWGVLSKTDAAKVASAGAMPGVNVTVSPTASPGAQAAAADPDVPGVSAVPTETPK